MSDKRRGLGRGLGALIPNTPPPVTRPTDVFFADRAGDGFTGNTEVSSAPPTAPTSAPAPTPAPRPEPPGARAKRPSVAERAGLGPRPTRPGTPTSAGSAPSSTAPAVEPASAGTVGEPGAAASSAPDSSAPGSGTSDSGTSDSGVPDAKTRGSTTPELAPVPGAQFAEIDVEQIRPNPKQPRTVFDEEEMAELVQSISQIGVLQPVVVRRTGEDEHPYELIMGERRWRASKLAEQPTVPAIIRDTTDDALLRDALLENLHRAQLNPLEEAAAYQQLLDDFGCTHDELAGRIGRSRPQISNTLRLLKLPAVVQRRVAAGVLSAGHARALLGLDDAAAMERLAQRIVAEGLSVRSVEEIVALGVEPEKTARTSPRMGAHHPQLDDLATSLSDRLDTRVALSLGRRKGKMTVEFASMDDLTRIIELLGLAKD